MEVNGTMYQGVLFAVPSTAATSNNSHHPETNNENTNITENGDAAAPSRSQSPSSNHAFNAALPDGLDINATLASLFGHDMSGFSTATVTE